MHFFKLYYLQHQTKQIILTKVLHFYILFYCFSGYAYVTGLCGKFKVSINEDKFHATAATIAAHELGHKYLLIYF